MLALIVASAVFVVSAGRAQAATYVTHCDSNSWAANSYCPGQPTGDRHTYLGGRAASNAIPYSVYHYWFVAYTSSNASTAKYIDQGPAGTTLYSSFPNNTQLLRGYSVHELTGALFGDGYY